ncbi:MAG: FHA domain-containing protein, partial [Actinomycetota bacterium]|nr:FHA domain-containing protein [Actinomycetota bacterium]
MKLHLSIAGAGTTVDVAVDADPETTLDQLADALRPYQPVPGPLMGPGGLVTGGRTLEESGLLAGSVLVVSGASAPAKAVANGFELAIVGGPDAGWSYPLGVGDVLVIGREAPASVLIRDPSVSRTHVRIADTPDGVTAEDVGSTNGTDLNTKPVIGKTPLCEGDILEAGATTMILRPIFAADAAVAPQDTSTLAYNRPMRIRRPLRPVRVLLPRRPTQQSAHSMFPLTAVLSPLVLGVVSAVIFKRPEVLILAVVSPVLALVNIANQRRNREKERHGEMGEYRRMKAAAIERAR